MGALDCFIILLVCIFDDTIAQTLELMEYFVANVMSLILVFSVISTQFQVARAQVVPCSELIQRQEAALLEKQNALNELNRSLKSAKTINGTVLFVTVPLAAYGVIALFVGVIGKGSVSSGLNKLGGQALVRGVVSLGAAGVGIYFSAKHKQKIEALIGKETASLDRLYKQLEEDRIACQ
jgi:hypothetical protein